MMDGLRFIVFGIVWWIVIEVVRGRQKSHSRSLWWLHVTAPLVALACIGLGIWLIWAQ
ncbi:MAG: hypothetical protein ACYTGW_11955 [Planctomycetota bacterium]|jgi:hypothetical protein